MAKFQLTTVAIIQNPTDTLIEMGYLIQFKIIFMPLHAKVKMSLVEILLKT